MTIRFLLAFFVPYTAGMAAGFASFPVDLGISLLAIVALFIILAQVFEDAERWRSTRREPRVVQHNYRSGGKK